MDEHIRKLWLIDDGKYTDLESPEVQTLLKDVEDLKMLEECFTKGILNARIIEGKVKGETKGFSMLAKLTIMANIKKDSGDAYKRDKTQIAGLVIRKGSPISDMSGRDLPSPAEIRGDSNVLLLPFYQEVEKRKE